MNAKRPIDQVLAAHAERLMAIPGVAIVFVGALEDGTPCIKVGVDARTPAIEKAIPRDLEGHPVVIEETGPIAPR